MEGEGGIACQPSWWARHVVSISVLTVACYWRRCGVIDRTWHHDRRLNDCLAVRLRQTVDVISTLNCIMSVFTLTSTCAAIPHLPILSVSLCTHYSVKHCLMIFSIALSCAFLCECQTRLTGRGVVFSTLSVRPSVWSFVRLLSNWWTFKFVSISDLGFLFEQEARLSLTNCATLFCKVVEVLQDVLSENVDKKFTTDYNVA